MLTKKIKKLKNKDFMYIKNMSKINTRGYKFNRRYASVGMNNRKGFVFFATHTYRLRKIKIY
jgi:hypothetical protein